MNKFEYKTYKSLVVEKGKENLTYEDLLGTIEWKKFRDSIIKKDSGKCTKCGKLANELAWELVYSVPGKIYIRKATSEEYYFTGNEHIYSYEKVELHAHHTYYKMEILPWQYPKDSLETVCSNCHKKIHNS